MIAVIRIAGKVKIKKKVEETLSRLKLIKKYTCVIIDEKNKETKGMLKKIVQYVAFGEIEKQTLIRLIEKRGKSVDNKKIDAEKIADELEKGKRIKDLGLKPFFRLHPAIGGFKSTRDDYPKGVLGNNKKDINKLIEKML